MTDTRRKQGERETAETKSNSGGARMATATRIRPAMLPQVAAVLAIGAVLLAGGAEAGRVEGTNKADLLFGADDDNAQNPVVQPAGASNQSLNNADAMHGKNGNDVMIGLLGSDTMRGGAGSDVLIGGTEQGTQPNSDIVYGDDGEDVNIWRGGDGSDAFIGGRGTDALLMGAIDRDLLNVPVIVPATGRFRKTGLPTAE